MVKTDKKLKDYKVVVAQTTDYGTAKEVKIVFTEKKTHKKVESVVIYHKETNEAEVISIMPVEEPTVTEPTEETGEEGEGEH